MSKTTKKVKPILSMQKFNQGDTVNSITLSGTTRLADVETDKQGHVVLTLKPDDTKASKKALNDLVTKVDELTQRLEALENKEV